MRGIEIMMAGILTAMQNVTYYDTDTPFEKNGDIEVATELWEEWEFANVSVPLPDEGRKEVEIPKEIKVTTWDNMPYSGISCSNGTCKGVGYAFDILHLVQEKLKFTYTLVLPKQRTLGNKRSGIMGQLDKKEVDVAVAFIPTFPVFTQISRFSTILDEAEISFLMKRPRESAIGSGLLAPFSQTVWICILVSWIFAGPIIYVIILLRSRVTYKGKRNAEGYSLSSCVWFTYGALLKQGATSEPVTDSGRLLFATWWIFITILTSFYTANLTAFLTLSEFTLPYNTIDDFVNKHQKWITLNDHTIQYGLMNDESSALERLRQSLERREGEYANIEEDYQSTLRLIETGKLFLADKYYIENIIFKDYKDKTDNCLEETKRCTYVMQPKNIYEATRAFAFPLNSTLQTSFDRELMHIVESGIVKHMRDANVPKVRYCPLNLKSKERRLRNTDLSMTYKVMCVGFVLSAVAFIGEFIFCCIHTKQCRLAGFGFRGTVAKELPVYTTDPRPHYLKQKIPSPYENLYSQNLAEKHFINGRDYWVITEQDGDRRLVPIRTPSALLFSYTT